VRCEQRPANEAGRSSTECVVHNRREPSTDVVDRAEQPCAATEYRVPTRDPGWSNEREPANPERLLRSQLGRDQAAERMADEVHALELGRLEATAEPARELPGGKSPSQPR
jgi:hypothetical protein